MGGKSFYCDYCCCFMKNNLNIRKNHNTGMAHSIAKVTYMKRFEDPQKIYEEELNKTPCTRYSKGMCKFGLYCQYSHFNKKQLQQLKKTVDRLHEQKDKNTKANLSDNNDEYSYAQFMPWQQDSDRTKSKEIKNKLNKYKITLPPSLKCINFKKFPNFEKHEYKWG